MKSGRNLLLFRNDKTKNHFGASSNSDDFDFINNK